MKLKLAKAYSQYGADMGRRNVLPDDRKAAIKLHLERLKWVDGDYDQGGAYWGGGSNDFIYCAYTDGVQYFVRASNRIAAKELVRVYFTTAKFFN
jgi:hypothetical protein